MFRVDARRSLSDASASARFEWLHGLTPARFGVVLALCVLYTLHSVSQTFAIGYTAATAQGVVLKLLFICTAALPFTVVVTLTDNVASTSSRGWRLTALGVAVLMGALCAGLIEASLFSAALANSRLGAQAMDQVYASNLLEVAQAHESGFLLAPLGTFWGVPLNTLAGFSTHWLMYGALATAVYYWATRERAAAAALHESQLRRQLLERQMTEARLQVLQAQIEPHFLFNTLATIQRLYLVDSAQGCAMLRSLSDYLRAALPQMRDNGSTLGRELELIDAYLRVQQVRMGERLRIERSVPEEVLTADLPPMMLLTLVENAIKHGLGPRPEGGTLRIRAERKGTRLSLVIEDNGVGFHQPEGSGVGLANTRDRLATLYGSDGRLLFEGNAEGGITVTLELPYRTTMPDAPRRRTASLP